MAATRQRTNGWGHRVVDYAVYLAARVLVCILQTARIERCEQWTAVLAWCCHDVLRIRRHVVDENLRHAFPEWTAQERRRTARRMWHHFLLMLCEIAHAPRKIHAWNWRRFISIRGREQLVQLMLDRRPVVAVTAHFGNFEMSGYLAGLLGFPSFTVARPLDNPYLHRYLTQFREATGQYMLPTQGSALQAQSVIEAGHTLAILGDHFGGVRGCWVPFFGREASCHKSVALFAIANACPLAVITTHRTRGPMQFELALHDVLDPAAVGQQRTTVPELTRWYTGRLEAIIRGNPQQYWWLHRRWKDPRPKKLPRATTRASQTGVRLPMDVRAGRRTSA